MKFLFSALLCSFALQVHAQTFIVANTSDSGAGSLREAITSGASGDSIGFDPSLSGQTITLISGQLVLSQNLTIDASSLADGITISGNNASRLLLINNGATVELTGLTLTHGRLVDGSGAGISNSSNCTLTLNTCTVSSCNSLGSDGADGVYGGFDGIDGADGNEGNAGGIHNAGTLTLSECTIDSNSAIGGEGGSGTYSNPTIPRRGGYGGYGGNANGGGILNVGTLTVDRCTFSSNSATGGRGGDALENSSGRGGHGGAGAISNSGTLSVKNSTFASNSGTGGRGGYSSLLGPSSGGDGGTGALDNSGTLTLVSQCTFWGNTADCGFQGSFSPSSTTRVGTGGVGGVESTSAIPLGGCIIAGGSAFGSLGKPDLKGSVTSLGYNLVGVLDGSTGITNGVNGDLAGTTGSPLDPLLESLADNGGPTLTMALSFLSPALNAGDTSSAETFDQRGAGFPRKQGTHLDIGAFELILLAPNVVSQSAGSVTLDPTTLLGSLDITATVNPNFLEATGWIEYGLSSNYGYSTTQTLVGSGTDDITVDLPISKLVPGVTWHYRVASSNPAGTSYGANQTIIIGTLGGGVSGVVGDLDGDGTVDASEFDSIRANLADELAIQNAAGYYTTSQVQALNVDTPLLTRNPTSGLFKLTLTVKKSTNLVDFTPIPMTESNTDFNLDDELEFEFSPTDSAAFYRLESK